VLLETPIGLLTVEASDRGVWHIAFGDAAADLDSEHASSPAMLARAALQIQEYFDGERQDFDLPLDLPGAGFRHRAWQAIAAIPYAEVRSYGEIAATAGNPLAYRAAGSACRTNPLPLVIPCHRVIGSDRGLHGFGGGLEMKRWLLAHEARVRETSPAAASTSLAGRGELARV
jgi:methylated-DNA-[protein]-cysteine S-methyltransferase